jgi:hypothetical protein
MVGATAGSGLGTSVRLTGIFARTWEEVERIRIRAFVFCPCVVGEIRTESTAGVVPDMGDTTSQDGAALPSDPRSIFTVKGTSVEVGDVTTTFCTGASVVFGLKKKLKLDFEIVKG